MEPYYESERAVVYHGDCLDVLRELPESSVDAVVTDPPYDLTAGKKGGTGAASVNLDSPYGRSRISTGNGAGGFMGKAWDATGIAFDAETWRLVLRVLKPGGHLLAFGGTRTWHRLACAIEDAGFEIRDNLAWMYGSGFPKSLDVSKAIDKAAGVEGTWRREDHPTRKGARTAPGAIIGQTDHTRHDNPEGLRHVYEPGEPGEPGKPWQGWGTALKPAYEPIVLARKPLTGTVASNVLAHGTGALNVDGCRIATDEDRSRPPRTPNAILGGGRGTNLTASESNPAGRWPANVVLDETAAAMLDEQSGESTSVGQAHFKPRSIYNADAEGYSIAGKEIGFGDRGGASRFFKVVKEDTWNHDPVSTAENHSHPSSEADVSAPGDAATSEYPDTPTNSPAPSTTGTASESRPSGETSTPPTPSTERASSLAWQPDEPSQMVSRARYAASLAQTDTTTTTASHSKSDGSAAPATSSTTPSAREPGGLASGSHSRLFYTAKAGSDERPRNGTTAHPTVKPLDLMRWLVRLVTPPGGTVLEPFAGSGTTVEACILEGFRCVAIEREADYLPLVLQRIQRRLDPVSHHVSTRADDDEPSLFDLLAEEGGAA